LRLYIGQRCGRQGRRFVETQYFASPRVSTPVKQYNMPLTEFNAGSYCLVSSTNIFFTLSKKPDYPSEYLFVFTSSDGSVEITGYGSDI
jgi:hypothetical protein